MSAKLRLHAARATFVSLAVILALAVVALVALSRAPAASAGPSQTSKVTGTWSDPAGACVAHIISFDPSTGDFVCTGTSHWTGTWTGSTTWTLTGNQSPTTGAVSGRIDEVFKGHVADGTTGALTFVEHITIDPAGNTDIRGSIVDSSGGLAHSQGHARWIGISNPDGSGSGSYFGQWHQGQPRCGDTITTDATLHHDLVNCPNNGIVIGADDVTLDLNYHRIDGDETPAAGCDPDTEFCDVGVLNNGHDDVTVVHGSVREFLVGVWGLRVSHNRLLGISSSENECCGLGFFRGTRSVIRNSSGRGNGAPDEGNGMFLIASHHVRVLHSSFRNNGDGIFVGVKGGESTHNLIKGNVLSRNSNALVLESSDRNRVRRNRSLRDGTGVLVALHGAQRNVIARNRIVHPTQARGGDGQGIVVPRGAHNVIARNSIRDPSRNAIAVGGEGVRGVGNVVRRNHVRGAGKDGVKVGGQAERTLLRGNRVRQSRDDGFDVASRTAKFTRNRAVGNGDLGIEAVRGVIDGGGNKASGNGDLRQCTNIVCS